MSFKSETYRVLIASPSDLNEERIAATEAINEWNAQHSAAEEVVLLPIKWETHAIPTSGIRPQEAINRQLVVESDLLIGMFWTKLGASTGIADSGTIEEIDHFVSSGKPALLYFSNRPIDPSRIDLHQHKKLRQFKKSTYNSALVGNFASINELQQTLIRDLTNQIRQMRRGRPLSRLDELEQATRVAELLVMFREKDITPNDFYQFKSSIFSNDRSDAQTIDPVKPGEIGPNGHRIGYNEDGDKVEWIPDDENPGQDFPLILRRNDKSILEAEQEFMDIIWYDRKLVLLQSIAEGKEKIKPSIMKGMIAAMRETEKKYGKERLENAYKDDFEWGMLNGKLSALRWVLGNDWDMLDT